MRILDSSGKQSKPIRQCGFDESFENKELSQDFSRPRGPLGLFRLSRPLWRALKRTALPGPPPDVQSVSIRISSDLQFPRGGSLYERGPKLRERNLQLRHRNDERFPVRQGPDLLHNWHDGLVMLATPALP